jgi:hypothetical protein
MIAEVTGAANAAAGGVGFGFLLQAGKGGGGAEAASPTAAGAGGATDITGATGGDGDGTDTGGNLGGDAGAGGAVNIDGGGGGAGQAGTVDPAQPGNGGAVNITGGDGGTGAGTSDNADGADVNIAGGAPGTGGSGAAGTAGVINLNSDTNITGEFLPGADQTYSLGSASFGFVTAFVEVADGGSVVGLNQKTGLGGVAAIGVNNTFTNLVGDDMLAILTSIDGLIDPSAAGPWAEGVIGANIVSLDTVTWDVVHGAAQINGAQLSIDGHDAAQVLLALQGHTAQSANLIEVENVSGNILFQVDPTGNLTVGDQTITADQDVTIVMHGGNGAANFDGQLRGDMSAGTLFIENWTAVEISNPFTAGTSINVGDNIPINIGAGNDGILDYDTGMDAVVVTLGPTVDFGVICGDAAGGTKFGVYDSGVVEKFSVNSDGDVQNDGTWTSDGLATFNAGWTMPTGQTATVQSGGTMNITSGATFNFDQTTGTAPFTVDSTTVVTNLNADTVDGLDSGSFLRSDASDNLTTGNTLTVDSGATLAVPGTFNPTGTFTLSTDLDPASADTYNIGDVNNLTAVGSMNFGNTWANNTGSLINANLMGMMDVSSNGSVEAADTASAAWTAAVGLITASIGIGASGHVATGRGSRVVVKTASNMGTTTAGTCVYLISTNMLPGEAGVISDTAVTTVGDYSVRAGWISDPLSYAVPGDNVEILLDIGDAIQVA